MIVLKCDNCKKEIEMAFEISINQRPYTVADMLKREQLKPITTEDRCLCDKCYEEVMSLIYPQGDKEMTDEELKEKYCCRCVNSDCNLDCVAKQEAPFDMFVCDNGEMFEEYEE